MHLFLPPISSLLVLQASTTVPSSYVGSGGGGNPPHLCGKHFTSRPALQPPRAVSYHWHLLLTLGGSSPRLLYDLHKSACVPFQSRVFKQNICASTSLKRSSQPLDTHIPIQIPFLIPQAPSVPAPPPFSLPLLVPSFVRFPLCSILPLLCPSVGSHFPPSFILAIGTSLDAVPPSSAPCLSYLKSNLMQTQMSSQLPQISTVKLLLWPLPVLLLHAYAVPTTSLATPSLLCIHHPRAPWSLCCAYHPIAPPSPRSLIFLPPTHTIFSSITYIIFSIHFLSKLCHF